MRNEFQKFDLDNDEVFNAIVHTLILILILIVLPLVIFITNMVKQAQAISYCMSLDNGTVINKLYNKQIYGRIRDV